SESLKPGQRMHFQLVCLYIDNYNQRYLRLINYTLQVTNELSKVYSNVDVDCLAKLSVMKEVHMCYGADSSTARDALYNRIVNSLYFYRTQCSKHTPIAQLILPASVKYYPLYMNSLIKKPVINS